MSSFKKKNYTEPVINRHQNDVLKDWYVFFRFKYDGKIFKFKRREGINRIKDLNQRLNAISELCDEIAFDLKHGWNPILDPKREVDYNPYYNSILVKAKRNSTENTKKKLFQKYYRKGSP
jgi:hypothetical protein